MHVVAKFKFEDVAQEDSLRKYFLKFERNQYVIERVVVLKPDLLPFLIK